MYKKIFLGQPPHLNFFLKKKSSWISKRITSLDSLLKNWPKTYKERNSIFISLGVMTAFISQKSVHSDPPNSFLKELLSKLHPSIAFKQIKLK